MKYFRPTFSGRGFTLIEMVVAVIITAILAGMAVVYYGRFTERTRAADADNLLGLGVYAQGRQLMRKGKYTPRWTALDGAPALVYSDKNTNNYLSLDGTIFYTKGGASKSAPKSGFAVYFEDVRGTWFAVAKRVGHMRYHYTLVRPFGEEKVYCLPDPDCEPDQLLCMDYMNVETPESLPPDPRLSVPRPEEEEAFY